MSEYHKIGPFTVAIIRDTNGGSRQPTTVEIDFKGIPLHRMHETLTVEECRAAAKEWIVERMTDAADQLNEWDTTARL